MRPSCHGLGPVSTPRKRRCTNKDGQQDYESGADFEHGAHQLAHENITVVMCRMAIAQSKLTSQGQISVPAEVRKKLGVGPGSVLEWDEEDNRVVVRRAGRYSSEQVHDALFPEKGPRKSPGDVKEGIRKYISKRHARR